MFKVCLRLFPRAEERPFRFSQPAHASVRLRDLLVAGLVCSQSQRRRFAYGKRFLIQILVQARCRRDELRFNCAIFCRHVQRYLELYIFERFLAEYGLVFVFLADFLVRDVVAVVNVYLFGCLVPWSDRLSMWSKVSRNRVCP